ncbi:MAG: X2-like carbohydrate binding domain-containing protein [Clostridiaceae bacterium]
MKAAKKILSLALAACMAFLLLPLSALADSPPVCEIGATPYYSLDGALEYALASSTDTPTTIRLLDDISYEGGIKVENKTVTFDLNGFNLEVENDEGDGMEVGTGGVVTFTGYDEEKGNEFYVEGAAFNAGVYAHDGGRATVSRAEGFVGAFAECGGEITVLDGVWGIFGVRASGSGAKVTVNGSVKAEGGSGGGAAGVAVDSGGQVIINGDLEVSDESVLGVQAIDKPSDSTSSTVYINGVFTVDEEEESISEYIEWFGGANDDGGGLEGEYLHYTDGYSHVYMVAACVIGTTVYVALDEALSVALDAPAGTPTTIKLLRDIDYYRCLVVVDKTITFDLNGHELNVMASGDGVHGLEVGAGGVVNITGDTGEGYSALDVHSSGGYGVYAHNGGQVAVTRAGGLLGGVWADGGAIVGIRSEAYGTNVGVAVSGGSTVTVGGEISTTGYGTYIMLGTTPKSINQGVPDAAPYETYLVYSDGSNTVRVKTDAVCKLSIVTPSDGTYTSLYNTLGKALNEVTSSIAGSKATITLFADIEHPYGIEVYNKTITFNLNGHTLNMTSDEWDGLYVGMGGVVNIAGDGEFNVKSTGLGCGVLAVNGGQATVTNAVSSNGTGAAAEGEGSKVVVMGNVTGADGIGAPAGTEVIVHGNVTALDADGWGVYASDGGLAVIDGTITVQDEGVYIELSVGETFLPLDPDNGVPMTTGTYAGYLRYTEGTNHVYVKVFKNATLNPATAAFNKNPSKQADVTATVTWNSANSITAVRAGDTPLISPADYSVSGNTLTINKAYLATEAVGSLALTVMFDKGAPATLTITVSNTGSGGAAPGGDDGPAYGERTLNDAATGVSVSGGGIHGQARLTVTPVDTQSLPDALKQAAAKGALLLGFEVTLSGGFRGELTISFPVGAQYNGQTVTVLHYVNGKTEAHTAVVADGRATITVTGLSPFAVVLPAATVKVPNTGGAAAAYGFALVFLAAISAGYAVRKRHKA